MRLFEYTDVSYNRPNLCPNTTWQQNSLTWIDTTFITNISYGLYLDTNDILYVQTSQPANTLIFQNSTKRLMRNISHGNIESQSIFVDLIGDVYVDRGIVGTVDRWILNTTAYVPVMNVSNICTGLFMDSKEDLYCSMWAHHIIVKASLIPNGSITVVVAGNTTPGDDDFSLNGPIGIFIDLNDDLYVADSQNHRIQRFEYGNKTGQTVLGNVSISGVSLNYPRSVIIDGENNLYVADSLNHRIIRLTESGIAECIAACQNSGGQFGFYMNEPVALAFDSIGNLFVLEKQNRRIQKFLILLNPCGELDIILLLVYEFNYENISFLDNQLETSTETFLSESTGKLDQFVFFLKIRSGHLIDEN